MEDTTIFLISLYLALSLVMGLFSVTQMGYQNRLSPLEMLWRVPLVFTKGFIGWIILFPYGLKTNKYKFKVDHKIGKDVG